MPRVGFEHAIRMFERPKTVYVLDRAVPVIGFLIEYESCYIVQKISVLSSEFSPHFHMEFYENLF
jgi:hypothetical protein